jgi:hypothetical protein
MTFAESAMKVPLSVGHGFGGSWIGIWLRLALTPVMGYDDARAVVAMALGPGHDYIAVDSHARLGPARGKRGARGARRRRRQRRERLAA